MSEEATAEWIGKLARTEGISQSNGVLKVKAIGHQLLVRQFNS